MPDEPTTPSEEVLDEQVPEEAPPVETPDEDEQPPVGEEDGPTAEEQLFAAALPEFADDYKNLDPQMRERLLAKRLAAVSAEQARPRDESETGVQGDQGRRSRTPPIPEPPVVDVDRMSTQLAETFGEEESRTIMDVVKPTLDHTNATTRLLVQALGEVRAELNELKVPSQLAQAVPQVPGARQSDIAAARKYLDAGSVDDPVLAMKLAKADRETQTSASTVTPASKRKARGIAASRSTGTSRAAGAIPDRIPTTDAEWRARMEAEEPQS